MENEGAEGMNATAASLLGLLADCGELTGGELVRTAEVRIGRFWTLTRSQVYRELDALERAGLVVPGPPGPREARRFSVTAQGRAAFQRWLVDDLPGETVRIPLLLAVGFGSALPPGRLAGLLEAEERRHRERLADYEALDAQLVENGAGAHVRATLAFGLHYERAVLDWFAELPPEVRG